MKTIEELVEDYYVDNGIDQEDYCIGCSLQETYNRAIREAYIAGAKAAQGWNEIKLDRNGVITQDCRAEIKANLPVLLMLSKDDFFAPKCYKAMNIDDWLTWSGKVNMGYAQTHWRQIEYK